jgi:hypothetical protein
MSGRRDAEAASTDISEIIWSTGVSQAQVSVRFARSQPGVNMMLPPGAFRATRRSLAKVKGGCVDMCVCNQPQQWRENLKSGSVTTPGPHTSSPDKAHVDQEIKRTLGPRSYAYCSSGALGRERGPAFCCRAHSCHQGPPTRRYEGYEHTR